MIHDWNSVVEKHAQTMLQLLYLVHVGKPGELEQIVNIPVTQIVEEITDDEYSSFTDCGRDREYSSYSDCGRDRRGEYSSYTDCGRDHRDEIPVPRIVEEIAEMSKSSIVWRSIPNLYFEEIKVFSG